MQQRGLPGDVLRPLRGRTTRTSGRLVGTALLPLIVDAFIDRMQTPEEFVARGGRLGGIRALGVGRRASGRLLGTGVVVAADVADRLLSFEDVPPLEAISDVPVSVVRGLGNALRQLVDAEERFEREVRKIQAKRR